MTKTAGIIIILIVANSLAKAQIDSLHNKRIDSLQKVFHAQVQKKRDSIGIPISKKEFDSIFAHNNVLIKIDKKVKLSAKQYIDIIRSYNTILRYDFLRVVPICIDYITEFNNKWLIERKNHLSLSMGLGGSYYSLKYKISIGEPIDNTNVYKICNK